MKKKLFRRIYVEITNLCNLSCAFCPQTKRAPRSLNPEEFEHIIKEIRPYSDFIYLHVKGEPLLHPNLGQFLALCQDYQLQVNLTTNGTLLDQAWPALSQAPALRQINLSLHSLSGNPGMDFKEYLTNLLEKVTYFSQNTDTICALRLWNLEQEQSKEADRERNRYVLEYLENYFHYPGYIDPCHLGKHGIKLAHHVFLHNDYEFTWPSLELEDQGLRGTCHGTIDQLGILSNGTVIPCCLDQDGEVDLGNIFSTPFSQIIQSTRFLTIKEGFQKHQITKELCRHCSFRLKF